MGAVTVVKNPSFTWQAEPMTFVAMKMARDPTLLAPAIMYSKITPTDTTALANGPTRGIVCGAAGVLYGQDAFGTQVNGIPVVAGWNPFSMAGIDSTSTTATNIWGIW